MNDFNKKEKNLFTGSSQVYGRHHSEKTTEIGHLANGTCTFGRFVADLFTARPERAGKSRAAPYTERSGG